MDSQAGRNDGLIGRNSGLKNLAEKIGANLTGTSIFDPVLCEVIYNWYGIKDGTAFDPFAGGSVRGVIAELLGQHYIGIDLSENQIDANQLNADKFGVTPKQYILKAKIDASNILLLDTSLQIKEIAMTYHFADSYHFSHTFKRFMGVSPEKFRLRDDQRKVN